MKKIILSILLIALNSQAEVMPDVPQNMKIPSSDIIWNKYCSYKKSVVRESLDIPKPNYDDGEVRSAATRLVQVSPYSFYFYAGPLSAYQLVSFKAVSADPKAKKVRVLNPPPPEFRINSTLGKGNLVQVNHLGKENAHAFLTLLCGEFRDRPSLIYSKIQWINQMFTLDDRKQDSIQPATKSVWKDMAGSSYSKYIGITKKIFAAKEKKIRKDQDRPKIKTPDGQEVAEYSGVEPFSVCETKFIMTTYVAGNATLPMINPNKAITKPTPYKYDDEEEGDEDEGDHEDDYEESYSSGASEMNVSKYRKLYRKYAKANCSQDEKDYFYNFRGDSNFKPNSPESNGMIWYSSSIGNACIRSADGKSFTLKETAKAQFAEDPDICNKYFAKPFQYRWSAARAGLATWMMYDSKYKDTFDESGENVTITPHLNPDKKPFSFSFKLEEPSEPQLYLPYEKNDQGQIFENDYVQDPVTKEYKDVVKILEGEELKLAEAANVKAQEYFDKAMAKFKEWQANKPVQTALNEFLAPFMQKQEEFWKKKDLGFNEIFGLGTKSANRGEAYFRIRNAVNRHTDWYASAYDDGSGKIREEAYSPFVASSYEMSASNGFTQPGVTVNSPADGCKHWMFIFKLHKSQWYSYQKLHRNQPVDFNRNWFDETSFGTNHLADSERALDRLGTALEGEMDSILYLNKLDTSGNVDMNCGKARIEEMKASVATGTNQ